MTKYLPFYLDLETILVNPKCYILTGENLEYLTAFLNSKLFKIAYRNNFPELQGGTRELHKIYFTELAVKKISEQENIRFKELVDLIQDGKKRNLDTTLYEQEIENRLFEIYELTTQEIEEVQNFEF